MSQRNKWLEKIGRTGLKTVKFDTGTGGIPEFDPLDFAHMFAGLNSEASAWVMFAYSNSEDETSLNKITSLLSKVIIRKHPVIKPKGAVGLVKIILREVLQRAPGDTTQKRGAVIARAKAMGIARSTYHKHQNSINQAIELILSVVDSWEEQAAKVSAARLRN
ncbi:hypothetical protein ACBZ90_17440 [Vibrio alginolyticus]